MGVALELGEGVLLLKLLRSGVHDLVVVEVVGTVEVSMEVGVAPRLRLMLGDDVERLVTGDLRARS